MNNSADMRISLRLGSRIKDLKKFAILRGIRSKMFLWSDFFSKLDLSRKSY